MHEEETVYTLEVSLRKEQSRNNISCIIDSIICDVNVSGKRRTFEWFGAAVDHPASDHPPAIPLSSIRIHNRRRVFKPTIPCTRLRTHTLESHQRGQAVPERKQANHSKATPENLSHALDRSEEHHKKHQSNALEWHQHTKRHLNQSFLNVIPK